MSTKKSEDTDGGRGVPASGDAEPGPTRPEAAAGPVGPSSETPSEAAPAQPIEPIEPIEPMADPYAVSEPPAYEAQATEADPAEAAHTEAAEDEHEEERGWSFAARALAFLILLLAGAGLGIWAAPRLAPALPSGLAPVAAWLTPGQAEAEARVAALEARLDGEIGALGGRIAALPDAAAVSTAAAGAAEGAVDAARTDLAGQIDALRAELDQSNAADASERVGRLETAVDGVTAELGSLRDQIASGAATLSADATQSIDTYQAELDGLRAEVEQLSGSVSGFDAQLEEARTSAEARVTEAEAQAQELQQAAATERDLSAAQADLALIRAALASGAPFEEPLANLAASAGVTPPEGLSAAAASGVATPAALRTGFSDGAHAAIRASIVASSGDGVIARSRAFLESQVASRSLTPRQGMDPDAVLSRMEDELRSDDLQGALAEANQLPSEAAAAMQEWLAAAKLRADAEAGLAELSASVSTIN